MWQDKTIADTVSSLGTSLSEGLPEAAVESKLEEFGRNELRQKKRASFFKRLWDQLNDFLILILIASAIISGIIGWSNYNKTGETTEFIEAGAIMAIVVLNAVMGLVQEGKAEQALDALKKMAAPNATVIRGGAQKVIPSTELVPGDLVVLETGYHVPADVRLVESVNLRIEEASLTGESVPVEKNAADVLPETAAIGDRSNCGYMSTTVAYGRGRGIVVATGMQTEIGKIAEMIQTGEEEPTPLQIKLAQLGKTLGIGALIICAVVGLIGILRDTDLSLIGSIGLGGWFSQSLDTIVQMFMVAVSLAIAAVPEGLPAVVTICLALGMQEMVKRHALIRRLPAVETLGSATAICSDKTGTLTQNQMVVTHLYADDTLVQVSGQSYIPHGEFFLDGDAITPNDYPGLSKLAQIAVLCNDAKIEHNADDGDESGWMMTGDPTEGALVVMGSKAGYWKDALERTIPRIDEVPFDSKRKRMTTIHRLQDGSIEAFVKGAPDLMLALCDRILLDGVVQPLSMEAREHILSVNHDLASSALRVLGMAYRPLDERPDKPTAETIEHNLIFVGLAGMIDPARPEVGDAIAKARRAGIKSAMVTGDYEDTAVAIAQQLNLINPLIPLHEQVLSGARLDQTSDATLAAAVDKVVVYARVSPENKVRIVEAHKAAGYVVAMTGDGVNDAPALKRASIGVAMGITGTDVSKETADMVLTDDNYASIVSAVEQGRIIYSNIRKFVYFLLSCNMGEIMILFLAMILDWPLPLTALQLLVLNLLTDGAPALAIGMEKGDPDIMEQQPRPVSEPIINKEMMVGVVVQTIAIAGSVLAAFQIGLARFESLAEAQTMAFVALSGSELLRAYTARSERLSVFKIGIFSNKWMQWAVLASFTILMATVYVPGLNTQVFGNVPLTFADWLVVLPVMLIPSVAAEIQKWIARKIKARQAAG
ncbi:MAG: cation-translocating P-type ATPase [Chloroflexi bacterium]|nr:cation-translocating P-type ATPase [Chloroflexota bacterium]